MDGGRVQLRPLVAYVLLAALAGLMMTGAFNADPRHVIEPGAAPGQFAATSSETVVLGNRLSPGAGPVSPPVTAPVSASGQPILVVHPLAQGAVSGHSSVSPASHPPATSSPTTQSSTTTTQVQHVKPGKAKAKGKAKGNGHRKAARVQKKSRRH